MGFLQRQGLSGGNQVKESSYLCVVSGLLLGKMVNLVRDAWDMFF